MTLTAKLNLHHLLGRADGKGIATGTDYLGIVIILRMNLRLHSRLASVNANLPPVVSYRLKLNHAVNQGINGIVPAHADVSAGVDAGAPLANYNRARIYILTVISFNAKPL